MDRQAALQAYIQAIMPERERILVQGATNRARGITRGMTPEAEEAYLHSRAFANAVYQAKRGDEVYQGLLRGELLLERWRAEFERLAPLIDEELRRGNAIDLELLRTVQRGRVSLKKARSALALVEKKAPRKLLDGQTKRLVGESCDRLERYLSKADLSALAAGAPAGEKLAPWLVENAFGKGIPVEALEGAWRPRSLSGRLYGELYRAHPELAACGRVRAGDGETIADALKREIDREKATTPEERNQLMRQCLLSDVFITGANAISLDGQMVNIDGNGNRVAAIVYGPKSVVVVAGMNKVMDTLESAVTRARTIAAPMNKQRFPAPTPCMVTGTCADCKAEGCICNQILITRRNSGAPGRIKFILVGEELGF